LEYRSIALGYRRDHFGRHGMRVQYFYGNAPNLTNIQEHDVDKYVIAGIRFSWAFIWSVTQ